MRLSEMNDKETPLRIRRLTTPDTRIPASPALQQALLPSADRIENAALVLLRA